MSSHPTVQLLSVFAREAEKRVREARIVYRFQHARANRERWLKMDRSSTSFQHQVLIDVCTTVFDGEQGRRFHALVSLLLRGGCKVWMRPSLRFLQSTKVFKWQALENVHPVDDSAPDHFDLCITDRVGNHTCANRTVKLTGAMYRGLRDNELAMPYGMHPDVYNSNQDLSLTELRQRERSWQLFFGGYRQQKAYKEHSYFPYLKTVNRHRVVETARQMFEGNILDIESEVAFENSLDAEFGGFVFVDSEKFRIPGDQWLSTLSRSTFFLAAPGTTYPMSHNCIESLAVGTIPVLEYPQVFRPALQDGVNCIVYRGLSEFAKIKDRLAALSLQDIARMRTAAANYYDQHLSGEALVQKLLEADSSHMHMFAHLAKLAA